MYQDEECADLIASLYHCYKTGARLTPEDETKIRRALRAAGVQQLPGHQRNQQQDAGGRRQARRGNLAAAGDQTRRAIFAA